MRAVSDATSIATLLYDHFPRFITKEAEVRELRTVSSMLMVDIKCYAPLRG